MYEDEDEENYSPENFPYTLPKKYGEVKAASVECPGVYYITVLPENTPTDMTIDYYAVEQGTENISEVAKSYGIFLHNPAVYLFEHNDPNSGHYIIEYEISRYKVRHHETVDEDKTPLIIARYAAEHHPKYFGGIPAPLYTPWGQVTRYRRLMQGVFAFETERFSGGMAVWYPIWRGDLTASAKALAHFTSEEEQQDLVHTMPFAFYTIPESCIPIFELWDTRPSIHKYVDYARLMNAIWKHYPEYAMTWNAREQVGANDIEALFMHQIGFNVEVRCGSEHAIFITQNADDHFLMF